MFAILSDAWTFGPKAAYEVHLKPVNPSPPAIETPRTATNDDLDGVFASTDKVIRLRKILYEQYPPDEPTERIPLTSRHFGLMAESDINLTRIGHDWLGVISHHARRIDLDERTKRAFFAKWKENINQDRDDYDFTAEDLTFQTPRIQMHTLAETLIFTKKKNVPNSHWEWLYDKHPDYFPKDVVSNLDVIPASVINMMVTKNPVWFPDKELHQKFFIMGLILTNCLQYLDKDKVKEHLELIFTLLSMDEKKAKEYPLDGRDFDAFYRNYLAALPNLVFPEPVKEQIERLKDNFSSLSNEQFNTLDASKILPDEPQCYALLRKLIKDPKRLKTLNAKFCQRHLTPLLQRAVQSEDDLIAILPHINQFGSPPKEKFSAWIKPAFEKLMENPTHFDNIGKAGCAFIADALSTITHSDKLKLLLPKLHLFPEENIRDIPYELFESLKDDEFSPELIEKLSSKQLKHQIEPLLEKTDELSMYEKALLERDVKLQALEISEADLSAMSLEEISEFFIIGNICYVGKRMPAVPHINSIPVLTEDNEPCFTNIGDAATYLSDAQVKKLTQEQTAALFFDDLIHHLGEKIRYLSILPTEHFNTCSEICHHLTETQIGSLNATQLKTLPPSTYARWSLKQIQAITIFDQLHPIILIEIGKTHWSSLGNRQDVITTQVTKYVRQNLSQQDTIRTQLASIKDNNFQKALLNAICQLAKESPELKTAISELVSPLFHELTNTAMKELTLDKISPTHFARITELQLIPDELFKQMTAEHARVIPAKTYKNFEKKHLEWIKPFLSSLSQVQQDAWNAQYRDAIH